MSREQKLWMRVDPRKYSLSSGACSKAYTEKKRLKLNLTAMLIMKMIIITMTTSIDASCLSSQV